MEMGYLDSHLIDPPDLYDEEVACPNCGEPIEDPGAPRCPNCGEPVDEDALRDAAEAQREPPEWA